MRIADHLSRQLLALGVIRLIHAPVQLHFVKAVPVGVAVHLIQKLFFISLILYLNKVMFDLFSQHLFLLLIFDLPWPAPLWREVPSSEVSAPDQNPRPPEFLFFSEVF